MKSKIQLVMHYTYDDVLIKPGYSEVNPSDVQLESKFSKNISLNIPVVSAAMDTVTEAETAIVLAQEGGLGVLHKNLSPQEQAVQVEKVKKFEAGMVLSPVTVLAETKIREVLELKERRKITGVLVVDGQNKLVGILTNRDLQFEPNLNQLVKDVMTPKEKLITATESIDMIEAKKLLHKNRIEKLPIVDQAQRVIGLITVKDIQKSTEHPNASKDEQGKLRVGAAVGVGPDNDERIDLLAKAGVDVIVVDSVAALVPKAEIEGEMGDSHMGLQARLMSQALRKITGNAKRSNCMVIFINQIRMKIGVMFGSPETTTGGNALKFYASVRLDIRRIGQVKEGDEIVGSETKVKVVKNKMAPPFKEALFQILYGKGVNQLGELVDLAVQQDIIQKAGAWYSYQGDKIGQGKNNVIRHLEENQQLAQEVERIIREQLLTTDGVVEEKEEEEPNFLLDA